jgi:hypothetical protein
MYSTPGSQAVLDLRISNIDTVPGHSFKLAWGTNEVTFTLATTPDDSGTQIRAASGGESKASWCAAFTQYLMYNYLLIKDFDIRYDEILGEEGDYFIELKAQEKGSDYDLTFSDNNVTGLSEELNAGGSDPVLRDGFKLITRTYLNIDSEDTFLGEDRIVPDTDGYANFNLSGFLKPQMENTSLFLFPETLNDIIIDRTAQCKKFFIKYAEIYDDIVRKLYSSDEDPNYIIPGGIDFIKLAKYHEDESSFWDMMQYNKDFLTWQPVNKSIWARQPEKLYYLVWKADTTTIKLMVKMYYTDDTTATITKETQACSQYQLYECVVSYNKFDLINEEASHDKEIEKYEVWIADQDDAKISISRFYTLDRKVYTNARIFIFRNSLSGYDTLRCTGESVKTTDLTRTTIEVLNDFDFTSKDAQLKNNIVFESQKFKTNTGFITKEYTEYLREFELSGEIYEFVLNRLYPILLVSTKSDIHKDNNYLHFREFEYVRAYKDSHYSYDENELLSKNFNKSFNNSYLTDEWHGS